MLTFKDLHFDQFITYSGHASTYPSPFTLMTKDHLNNFHINHEPHNLANENCIYPMRTRDKQVYFRQLIHEYVNNSNKNWFNLISVGGGGLGCRTCIFFCIWSPTKSSKKSSNQLDGWVDIQIMFFHPQLFLYLGV